MGEMSSQRDRFERRSSPWLVRVAALPRWTVLVAVIVLVVIGLLGHGWWAALALVLLALFLAWLAALRWPSLDPAGRVLRVLVVLIVLAAAVWRYRA